MSNYSFEDVENQPKSSYIRTAGIHENSKFISLNYELAPDGSWEAFDINLEDSNGAKLKERTFGPNIDKIFPKRKFEGGVQVGEETKEEAVERVKKEISKKLFCLAACFVNEDELRNAVKSASNLKSLVEKVIELIDKSGNEDNPINFLTIWKNNENKRTSKMILAENIKWVESTRFDPDNKVVPSIIELTPYQKTNQSFEKFPYLGSSSQQINESFSVETKAPADDLPF